MLGPDRPVSCERPVFAKGLASAKGRLLAGTPLMAEYPVSTEGFGSVEGLSAPDPPAPIDPVLVVPRFIKEMIAAQERGWSDKAPNLTIGQWLHAQPPAVQQRERLRALRRLGLVTL